MKIKCTREGTTTRGAGGYVAEFDEKGFATVDKEAGEALAATYPDIEIVEKKTTRKSSTEEE